MIILSPTVMTKTTMELISVYVIYISITLALADSDTFENQRMMVGGYIYPHRLGFLQCKSLCCRYGGCGAVSYLPEQCLYKFHSLNSRQSDMSDHRGFVTWIKNVSDKESCRECRSFCHGEEQCLVTSRGELKCVPAKRYFADEIGFKSARIPSNVDLQYLKTWRLSQKQMCRKYKAKNQRKEINIPLGDEKISVYYMLIHVHRTKSVKVKKTRKDKGPTGIGSIIFKMKCNSNPVLMITTSRRIISVYANGGRTKLHPKPSDLNTGLQMDVAVLFCPRKNILSAFILKVGIHKVTSFDFRKSHAHILHSSLDDFCLQSSSHLELKGECGSGISSKLLPIAESKQYMWILENATNALFDAKMSGYK